MYLSDLVKVLSLAAVLTQVSKSEPRSSLVALAWTLRNREKSGNKTSQPSKSGNSDMFYSETIPFCGKSIATRSWNVFTALKFGLDENYCKSLAIASLVWCGEEADPTAGSLHFHRHDDWPDWANNSEPVALIGSWFFYTEIDV